MRQPQLASSNCFRPLAGRKRVYKHTHLLSLILSKFAHLRLPKVRPRLSCRVRFIHGRFGLASSPLYYITALTALYESVAMIVDQHQPVVEKYYGPGKMTSVLKRLLEECDKVTKSLIEGWEEERSMKRKVRLYFRMLVHLLTAVQLTETSSTSFQALSTPAPMRRAASQMGGLDDEQVDAREVDKVLTEVAGMAGRWSLFRKFLYERLKVSKFTYLSSAINMASAQESLEDAMDSSDQPAEQGTQTAKQSVINHDGPEEELSDALQAVELSSSRQLMEDTLNTYYVPLEVWYMRTIIEKVDIRSIWVLKRH